MPKQYRVIYKAPITGLNHQVAVEAVSEDDAKEQAMKSLPSEDFMLYCVFSLEDDWSVEQ